MELTQKEARTLLAMIKVPHEIEGGLDFDHTKKLVKLKSLDGREEFHFNVIPSRYEIKKITYQTRARKSIILVRLDIKGPPHRNPDDEEIPCPHIHIYKEGYGDKWAYTLPKDFDDCTNLWDFLEEFCKFCNISQNPFNQPVIGF
nr:hypothetical protein [uncultured Psychrobacter sp.]